MTGLQHSLPTFLGILRFILGLSLPFIAMDGNEDIFIGVLITAFLADAIDGPIARYYHETSVQGARIDSIADFTVYCSLVVGVWILWPDIFSREFVYISIASLSILLPAITGLIRFRMFTSYHTWLVKFATVCIATTSVLLILGGPGWPFHIASLVSVVAGLEQITISLLLKRPQSDVKHLIAVVKQRNKPAVH